MYHIIFLIHSTTFIFELIKEPYLIIINIITIMCGDMRSLNIIVISIIFLFFSPLILMPVIAQEFNNYEEGTLTSMEYTTRYLRGEPGQKIHFEAYCLWYLNNKYYQRGFNFGLFLYPAVVNEYLISEGRLNGSNKYKKTSKVSETESFKATKQRTEEMAKALKKRGKK